MKSKWFAMTSNWSARSKTAALWSPSQTLASTEGSSSYPAGAVRHKVVVVVESAVAKRVTSWPRATKPSESVEAICSHGP